MKILFRSRTSENYFHKNNSFYTGPDLQIPRLTAQTRISLFQINLCCSLPLVEAMSSSGEGHGEESQRSQHATVATDLVAAQALLELAQSLEQSDLPEVSLNHAPGMTQRLDC